MRKQTIYYVNLDWGCQLRAAHSLASARKSALEEYGTNGFRSVRPATKKDVEWVRGMGGHVPEGVVRP